MNQAIRYLSTYLCTFIQVCTYTPLTPLNYNLYPRWYVKVPFLRSKLSKAECIICFEKVKILDSIAESKPLLLLLFLTSQCACIYFQAALFCHEQEPWQWASPFRSSLNQRRRFFFQNFRAKNGDAIDTRGSTLFKSKLQNYSKCHIFTSWKKCRLC